MVQQNFEKTHGYYFSQLIQIVVLVICLISPSACQDVDENNIRAWNSINPEDKGGKSIRHYAETLTSGMQDRIGDSKDPVPAKPSGDFKQFLRKTFAKHPLGYFLGHILVDTSSGSDSLTRGRRYQGPGDTSFIRFGRSSGTSENESTNSSPNIKMLNKRYLNYLRWMRSNEQLMGKRPDNDDTSFIRFGRRASS